MKNLLALLSIASLVTAQAFSQQRYLISPRDEVIPLKRDAAAATVIAERVARRTAASLGKCGTEFTFGFPEDKFPANSNFGANHKDLIGEWLVAKAAGRIDTIYWEAIGSVGALDSLLRIRIHRSLVGPAAGPGIRPGPYDPPCQNWGYWVNTNDSDQGIAPFFEEATDTTWVSTYSGPLRTFPPAGELLWDVTAIDHANRINQIPISAAGESLHIGVGDVLFVSFRVNGPAGHTMDPRTEFAASEFHVASDDENYPSRAWKFYEHDSGPTNCGTIPVDAVKRGWVARGGFTEDTLDVCAFSVWYSMTVSSNTPPEVPATLEIKSSSDTTAQHVGALINDCNPAYPAMAGIASAVIRWWINTVPQPDIPMTYEGGDSWSGFIPGVPPGTTVSYKVCAVDSAGLEGCGLEYTYVVFSLANPWYVFDTTTVCARQSIAATGTVIPKAAFFLPPEAPPAAVAGDDGTAGPFDIGREMTFFGAQYRYLWIGVDGMISLTASASDTVHLNDHGVFSSSWSLTGAGGTGTMPRTVIAPLLTDLNYGDSTNTCGALRFQTGSGPDSCLVTVEWDSTMFAPPLDQCDVITFRVVLNACDGTVEYQYDDLGGLGLDSHAVVGLKDSNTVTAPQVGIVFVNEDAQPYGTKPRPGWCVKFYPVAPVAIRESDAVPAEFALEQNYPNPFNPSTTFELRIPILAHVSLKVYDIVGREVATLVEEVKAPGVYSARWNADHFPTGAYFARMTAGAFVTQRKIVLTR